MKKIGLINKDISEVVASLGHKDILGICDAGLSIPCEVRRIDLTVDINIPRFLDVLTAVLKELIVERVILPEEIKEASPIMYKKILNCFSQQVELELVPTEKFKQMTKNAKAMIRTGQYTPYSDVLLVVGIDSEHFKDETE